MDEDPVEILVGMAERGDIDPWNIDIMEVTDHFLAELERRRELDLRISGRTLFFAATLLRMKSEYLGEGEEEISSETVEIPEGEDLFTEFRGTDPVDRLEREIQRRLGRKDLRKPPVTLYELIKLLKTAEKHQRRRQRTPNEDAEPEVIADDVVSIAHREDYQGAAARVLASLDPEPGQTEIALDSLCRRLEWPLPDVYIPLLFLTLEGKVDISQQEFYGELLVHRMAE
jgi:segregation and condensation protein A